MGYAINCDVYVPEKSGSQDFLLLRGRDSNGGPTTVFGFTVPEPESLALVLAAPGRRDAQPASPSQMTGQTRQACMNAGNSR